METQLNTRHAIMAKIAITMKTLAVFCIQLILPHDGIVLFFDGESLVRYLWFLIWVKSGRVRIWPKDVRNCCRLLKDGMHDD
jgi:hypothetical protein